MHAKYVHCPQTGGREVERDYRAESRVGPGVGLSDLREKLLRRQRGNFRV